MLKRLVLRSTHIACIVFECNVAAISEPADLLYKENLHFG